MITIVDVRLFKNVLHMAWIGELRYIDESKGKKLTGEMFNHDMSVAFVGDTAEDVSEQLEERITEILCRK